MHTLYGECTKDGLDGRIGAHDAVQMIFCGVGHTRIGVQPATLPWAQCGWCAWDYKHWLLRGASPHIRCELFVLFNDAHPLHPVVHPVALDRSRSITLIGDSSLPFFLPSHFFANYFESCTMSPSAAPLIGDMCNIHVMLFAASLTGLSQRGDGCALVFFMELLAIFLFLLLLSCASGSACNLSM